MAAATLSLALLLGGAAVPVSAAVPEMPRFLRTLDRAVNAGDWTLQCNSSQLCQIIGVVTPPRNHIGVRTVVMIERGIGTHEAPRLRLAFLDSLGALAVPPPDDHWRLIPKGRLRGTQALPLGLGPMEADGTYRAVPQAAAAIIAALRRWPGAAVHNGERVIARIPRGNLDRLMRRMDRLQHPGTDPLTPDERAQWLREYHYTILRTADAEETPAPDAVEEACAGRALPNRPFAYRIGPRHRLWIAECPEGNHIFLHPDGGAPIHFEMRDTATGATRPHDYAGLGGDSLLVLQLPRKDRIDCGHWVKFGWTGSGFAMILDRRYDRCRGVPYDFWPRVWYPTSWRYADAPPSDGGNAAPAGEGVSPAAQDTRGDRP